MTSTKPRIATIDLLKGLVMVLMALDHARAFFHAPSLLFDPTDPAQTTWPIYLTRWVTHFCAPAFSFLAGLSAFMVGKRKPLKELSGFLLKRGLWLVLIEVTIVSFGWKFDVHFENTALQVIWVLGASMIVLAGLVWLPKTAILLFSLVIIAGHNLLDNIHFDGSVLWALLHDRKSFMWAEGHRFVTAYNLLPWVAVMSLGYCFGSLYDSSFDPARRRKILNGVGIGSIALFGLLVALHTYGDPVRWTNYGDMSGTLMSILNVSKYPPSLMFLLITLGPALLFLANFEKVKGKVVDFFCVFGRVPFFYYILHLYLIHLLALFAAEWTGFGWRSMILTKIVSRTEELKGYGFGLVTVYLIWIAVVLALYPLCKSFDRYKQAHKEKWWLSYL